MRSTTSSPTGRAPAAPALGGGASGASAGTPLTERQQAILDTARQDGEVLVDTLAQDFNVTPQTVRRDLSRLCGLRLLQRTHGGAMIHDGVSNLQYGARKLLAAEAKQAIGERAASLIPNDASLFVNIGTTTEQVAHYLHEHVGMLVLTNNVNVVNILRPCESIELMTAGGRVRREDGGIVGAATVEFVHQFKVDYAVIGASAIESDGTFLDYDPQEVLVAKAIIENARYVMLVGDATKFERSAPVRIGNVASVDHFVTDVAPPRPFADHCRAHGVRLHVAADHGPTGNDTMDHSSPRRAPERADREARHGA